MKRLLSAIIRYLKDWRNILAHSMVGVLLLLIALFLPVRPIYRIFVLVAVVALNTLRMKLDDQRKARRPLAETES